MTKKKKIKCDWCKKTKEVEIVRKSSVVEGKYCSLSCYVNALKSKYED